VGLVEENDWNLLFGTLPACLVIVLALWSIGGCAWLPRLRLSPFTLVGGLFPSLGSDSPPERFRSSDTLVMLELVIFDMGHIRMHVLIVKGLEVPILEKGTLGTEGSM